MTDQEKVRIAWNFIKSNGSDKVSETYPERTMTFWTTPRELNLYQCIYTNSVTRKRYILNPLKFCIGSCVSEKLYGDDFIKLDIRVPNVNGWDFARNYTIEFLQPFSIMWTHSESTTDKLTARILILE